MGSKNYHIVLGLGFGDEGKGKVVDYLCELHKADLVVRFNGGAQAAHTVQRFKTTHTFHQFGAGTLLNVPTYYSNQCVFNPVTAVLELNELKRKGFDPVLYLDPRCPITTSFHMFYNRITEESLGHGSCGMGIWETFLLADLDPSLTLYVRDIYNLNHNALETKLYGLANHFENKLRQFKNFTQIGIDVHESFSEKVVKEEINALLKFFLTVTRNTKNFKLAHLNANSEAIVLLEADTVVFEGAQGFLLSKEHSEITPHVTASNVNFEEALNLIPKKDLMDGGEKECVHYYGVVRSYVSRHGNGPLNYEHETPIEGADSNNPENPYQGKIRTAPWSYTLLGYLARTITEFMGKSSTLVINHCDQQPARAYPDGKFKYTSLEEYLTKSETGICCETFFYPEMLNRNLDQVIIGTGPTAKDMEVKKVVK